MQLTQGLLRGNPNVTQPIPILFRSPIYLNHHGHHRCHHCYHSQLVILLSPYPPSSSPFTKIFHDELHFKDTLCNVIIPLRGAIHRRVREKVGISFQPGRGGGRGFFFWQTQFLVKISLGSVHKCDETHTTKMEGDISSMMRLQNNVC